MLIEDDPNRGEEKHEEWYANAKSHNESSCGFWGRWRRDRCSIRLLVFTQDDVPRIVVCNILCTVAVSALVDAGAFAGVNF